MVTLVLYDYDQLSFLEEALIKSKIEYELSVEEEPIGIKPPYLIVDGVPLSENKAMKWIKEHE